MNFVILGVIFLYRKGTLSYWELFPFTEIELCHIGSYFPLQKLNFVRSSTELFVHVTYWYKSLTRVVPSWRTCIFVASFYLLVCMLENVCMNVNSSFFFLFFTEVMNKFAWFIFYALLIFMLLLYCLFFN